MNYFRNNQRQSSLSVSTSVEHTVANSPNSVDQNQNTKLKPSCENFISKNDSNDVQLDSSSSSDDSETENTNEKAATPVPDPEVIPQHRHQDSGGCVSLVEENESQNQSTMWLGTEDGCIHVYNCTDNIRIKKNKIKIQHVSAVYSILYLDNRVFVSLANGDILVYTRDHTGWNTSTPLHISVGTITDPVTRLLNVQDKIWCAIQGVIKILNTTNLHVITFYL